MKMSPARFVILASIVLLAVLVSGIGWAFGAPAAVVTVLCLEMAVKSASISPKLGANVLTGLAADIYKAADIVGRELVGFIPGLTLNADATKRVALNDYITSHFTRPVTVGT